MPGVEVGDINRFSNKWDGLFGGFAEAIVVNWSCGGGWKCWRRIFVRNDGILGSISIVVVAGTIHGKSS